MINLTQLIEQHLFVNGEFSRQRARAKENIMLIQQIEEQVGKHKTISESVFLAYGGRPKICACGNQTAYISFTSGYRTYCSAACMNSSKEVKTKRTISIKHTCKEKYGVENVLQVPEIKEKAAATILSRYGVDNFAKHSLHQQKVKETSMKKYGVDHPLKATSITEQISKTMNERYGGFTAASVELHEKMKATMLIKYGAETSWQSPILLPKLHTIQKKKYLERLMEYKLEILKINNSVVSVKHDCGTEFELTFFDKPRCQHCKTSSAPEQELYLFLKSLGVDVIRNDRKILSGRELDLVVPAHKIAIEMNGVYWHHSETNKLSLLEKHRLAAEYGYSLIHIWDYEWYQKQSIIKSIIRAKLGLTEKIAARKCIVKSLDKLSADNFLKEHHLQGTCKSSIRSGLFYGDMLVGVATFGKSRFKHRELELLRMCFLPGVQIQGGVSKLLSTITEPLMTYADLRFGLGNGYLSAGMKTAGRTKPGYCWFSRGVVLSRYETQKSKLPALLGERFNSEKTEDWNMKNAGFLKLVDCGHAIFKRDQR